MAQVGSDRGTRALCYKNELTPIASITATAAASTANVCLVTIQCKDAKGVALTSKRKLEIWLSDDSGGMGVTGTTASGNVVASGTDGAVITALTAKKHLSVVTDATGEFILSITDTAKTAFNVCVANPYTGEITVETLATADYGS